MNIPTCITHESAEKYHAKSGEFLSSHLLGDFRKCPLLYFKKQEGLIHDHDSPAYLEGRAAHSLILEGRSIYEAEFVTDAQAPVNPRTGKSFGSTSDKYKEWADGQDKEVITSEIANRVEAMNASVRFHEHASRLLTTGVSEGVVRGEHLWLTRTVEDRQNGREGSVRKLSDIRDTLRENSQLNHEVPLVGPVEFAQSPEKLPVDSYKLGLFLGDGCFSGLATIIHSGKDNPEESFGALDVTVQCKRGSRGDEPDAELIKILSEEGIKAKIKFIPQEYLLASIEERTQLLRGLLDCDEAVRLPGVIEFSTVSLWLAHDLCFLIRSLGGSAMRGDKDGIHSYAGRTFTGDGCTYRIHASFPSGITTNPVTEISPDIPVANICHSICSIEPLGEEECMCIRTDAPDSLYVTDDFILTHNSTYAAQIPSVIFIDTEGGLSEIDCVRFPQAASFSEVMEQLKALVAEKHEYGAVAIDSCDWLERLVWEEVCKDYGVNSIEKAAGGYGKGYIEAANRFRKLLELLDKLRLERGMAIILIAHSRVEPFTDPDVGTYDRYSPRLHKHASAILGEWCDAIFFATRRISIQNATSGDGKIAKGIGANGGERILRCEGGPACVAKNRYGLPLELPLNWPAFVEALSA